MKIYFYSKFSILFYFIFLLPNKKYTSISVLNFKFWIQIDFFMKTKSVEYKAKPRSWNKGVPMASRRGQILLAVFSIGCGFGPNGSALFPLRGFALCLFCDYSGCNETFPHTWSEGAVTMSLNLTTFQKLSWSPWRVKTGELAASADGISTRTDPIPSPIMCVKNETHTAGTETVCINFKPITWTR